VLVSFQKRAALARAWTLFFSTSAPQRSGQLGRSHYAI
jgi:hypothetical protein